MAQRRQYVQRAFSEVWGMIWELPAPEFVFKGRVERERLRQYVFFTFPCFGLLSGLLLGGLAWLVGRFPGDFAGTALFGVLSLVLMEILHGGRGLSVASAAAEEVSRGGGWLHSLYGAGADIHEDRGSVGLIAMVFMLLLRGLAAAMLYRADAVSWLALVYVLSYTFQTHLASLPGVNGGAPLLESDCRMRYYLWGLALMLMLLVSPHAWLASCVALALSCGLAYVLGRYLEVRAGGITGSVIGGLAYVLETLALLWGAGMLC